MTALYDDRYLYRLRVARENAGTKQKKRARLRFNVYALATTLVGLILIGLALGSQP